jgi:hypothetical protein
VGEVFEPAVDCLFFTHAPVCGSAFGGDLRVGMASTLSAGLRIYRSLLTVAARKASA